MKILDQMIKNIEEHNKIIKIGLPDGNEERILQAKEKLNNIKNIEVLIISDEYIKQYENKKKILEIFKEKRGDKNTIEELEKWLEIPNYFAMALLEIGEIDCIVGGATTPTSDLLRPALQIVKPKENLITSFMWMAKDEDNYFVGDCAIIPEPKKEDIPVMGKLIANEVKNIFNIDPYIAMLSFSTNGSGGTKVESVNNMKEASDILFNLGYKVLGETQFDAAFDYETRKLKWKSDIKESPNVYIFPDLNSGNIGYKIWKLTGDFKAIGPIIVGLNKPVNDLSRGCDVEEIYILSIITMNMAI